MLCATFHKRCFSHHPTVPMTTMNMMIMSRKCNKKTLLTENLHKGQESEKLYKSRKKAFEGGIHISHRKLYNCRHSAFVLTQICKTVCVQIYILSINNLNWFQNMPPGIMLFRSCIISN